MIAFVYLGAGLGEPVPHEVLVDDGPPDVEGQSCLESVFGQLHHIRLDHSILVVTYQNDHCHHAMPPTQTVPHSGAALFRETTTHIW